MEQLNQSFRPNFHLIGGQLRQLHQALCNPCDQKVNITFIGDSITWGANLPDNATAHPRNGTLANPRDGFASGSFVNQFKRYIGATYFENTLPTLSNWPDSKSGESTATFSRIELLYPGLPPFSEPIVHGRGSIKEVQSQPMTLGYRFMMGIRDINSHMDISFKFTGERFTIIFCSIPSSADYELFIDGESIGTYKSDLGILAHRQKREHHFPYVRDKTITIRAKLSPETLEGDYLNIEAIEIEKEVIIVNQGLYGLDCLGYAENNFGTKGQSVVTADMNFAFIQLGTNDRAPRYLEFGQPNGISNFQRNLSNLISLVSPHAKIILMNANPVENEKPSEHAFSMRAVRDTVFSIGCALGIDVIDNYSIFSGLPTSAFTEDGGHPNLLGHSMMAANIIAALNQA